MRKWCLILLWAKKRPCCTRLRSTWKPDLGYRKRAGMQKSLRVEHDPLLCSTSKATFVSWRNELFRSWFAHLSMHCILLNDTLSCRRWRDTLMLSFAWLLWTDWCILDLPIALPSAGSPNLVTVRGSIKATSTPSYAWGSTRAYVREVLRIQHTGFCTII